MCLPKLHLGNEQRGSFVTAGLARAWHQNFNLILNRPVGSPPSGWYSRYDLGFQNFNLVMENQQFTTTGLAQFSATKISIAYGRIHARSPPQVSLCFVSEESGSFTTVRFVQHVRPWAPSLSFRHCMITFIHHLRARSVSLPKISN